MADDVLVSNSPTSVNPDYIVSTQQVTADSSQVQDIQLALVAGGVRTRISSGNPLPVSVGTVTVTGGLTDTQLRATPVPVSGTVALGAGAATIGALTANQSVNVTQIAGGAIAQGHGVAATAIRVELPTDGTGIVGLAAGTNGIGKLTANSGVDIGDVDVTSVLPGVAALNLGKAEDAAHTTGDVGVQILAVRNDAGGALAGTTGDYIPLTTNSAGALYVTGGGGGTQYVEDTASAGGETMTLAGVVRQDTLASSTSTDGDYAYMKVTAAGSLYVADAAVETAMARTAIVTDGSSKDWQEIINGHLVAGVPQAVDATHGMPVSFAQIGTTAIDSNSGNKSAGTLRVVIATDQPNFSSALNVALAANQSVNLAQVAGATIAQGHGTAAAAIRVELPTDGTGIVGLAAGANAIGSVTTELGTGYTTFCNTALSNTKTAVKASAGKVYGWMIHNPSAATVFIQVWNVAIGSITVGTTAPTWVIPLPAGASANVFSSKGVTHSVEINVAATTTATGSTAPATAAVVSIFYI